MPPQAKQCYPNHKEGSEYSNAGHVKAWGVKFHELKEKQKGLVIYQAFPVNLAVLTFMQVSC